MSKIIAISQQKGGAGKTTVSANIGCGLSLLGHRVLFVDMDPQQSLTMWFSLREHHLEDNKIALVTQTNSVLFEKNLPEYQNNYDFIVIDTPPHLSSDSQHIIHLSDYVLIPSQPSPLDVWASQMILDVATEKNIPHLVVINRLPAQGKIAKDLLESLQESNVPLAQTTLGNRTGFVTAFLHGLSVLETEPSSPASREINSLLTEVLSKMLLGSMKQKKALQIA